MTFQKKCFKVSFLGGISLRQPFISSVKGLKFWFLPLYNILERAGYSFIFQEWPVDLCTGFSFGFISKLQWQVHYGFDRCPGKNYVQY